MLGGRNGDLLCFAKDTLKSGTLKGSSLPSTKRQGEGSRCPCSRCLYKLTQSQCDFQERMTHESVL